MKCALCNTETDEYRELFGITPNAIHQGYCSEKCLILAKDNGADVSLWEDKYGEPELDDIIKDFLIFGELWISQKDGKPIFLINCGDTFAYACADAEEITTVEQFKELLQLERKYGTYASTIWCCMQRNLRPLPVVQQNMKDTGHWIGVMDKLRPNYYENPPVT